MRTLEQALDTADRIEEIVEAFRQAALKLAQENDRLRAELKNVMREREMLLDQLRDVHEGVR